MKTLFSIVLVGLVAYTTCAQTDTKTKKHHAKKDGGTNAAAGGAAAPAAPSPPDPVADQIRMVEQYQKSFVPAEPWRVMNERTNFAKGPDWVQFEGRVVRVADTGLTLSGWYGEPLAYMMPTKKGGTSVMTTGNFILSNYPRHVALGQLLSRNDRLVAMKSGTKDDLVNLDYGTVWVPEVTEEQKAAAVSAKTKADARLLAWHKEQAEKGDAYGEYKMGLRYVKGDGVEVDLAKARDMFTKSAAQGNKDATDELAKLPAK